MRTIHHALVSNPDTKVVIKWNRACPSCLSKIEYKTRKLYLTANRKCTKCSRCASTRYKYQYTQEGNLFRICPVCGDKVVHVSKASLLGALRNKARCRKCSVTIDLRGYCKTPSWTGKTLSLEHKRKISKSETGKVESDKTKRRKRIAHLKCLRKRHNQIYPNYNPEACKLIEEYGKKHGYNFQHAENGGEFHIEELGFWVDGYDREKNVVIEVYEPSHKNIKKQEKDLMRKEEISEHLKCEFIELWI